MGTWALTRRGRRTARRASDSSALETAARWGFVARGVLYLLVGLLAMRIAFGDGKREADRGGALAEVAAQPLGQYLLWALGIGLAGMALWRLSEALFGAAGPDGHKPRKRLLSLARFLFYGFVSHSVLSFAAGTGGSGSGSSDDQSEDVTARAMQLPAGQWIVAIGGLAIAVAGVWIAGRAVLRKYRKHLKTPELRGRTRQAVDVTGVAGGIARGAVFAMLGGFAVKAAVDYEPDRAKGIDDTLRSFADTSAGPWLLALIAVGLAMFGLFSFAMARWRRI
ncbi:DUF1206 domain-containing protein [Streptomyces sp. ISL-100]|uniref:DUF1206 domain-containing protein n=1 Tax=Streptomyces sp. ISL-100 TaxID=2819173 RepID=UPI001BE9F477|nr:DUF1206 domain-containing protein [Streptomyces sp. ISL-100]MBT2397967.1 DUF1206 domain-containing protein [Streptomyces sp. ISL-100]